jgi:SAM-dependent methyltransferase
MMSTAVVSRAYAMSYEDRIAFMKRFIAPYLNRGSRVLDAGCGRRNCLIQPTEVRELIGVDCDPHAIRENRSISRGVVADLDARARIDVGEKVDFAMCVDVAEHLSNPVGFVGNVAAVLKPGGHFFIAAPNKMSMAGMFTTLLPIRAIKSLSRIIEGTETLNHAHHYRLNTVSSIGRCLRSMGFDELRFVLLSPRMGKKGSMRRLLLLPDYWIGRSGLLRHYSLQILCLARRAQTPPDPGTETGSQPNPT